MEVLRFEEYNELLNEAEIVGGDEAEVIDLNDKSVKIKEDVKYSFLGIEFTATYTMSSITDEPYHAIIRRPGSDNGTEKYWGDIITAESIGQLQHEIRFSIKAYIEDNPVIESAIFEGVKNNTYTFRLPIILATGYIDLPQTYTKNSIEMLDTDFYKKTHDKIIKALVKSINKADLAQYMGGPDKEREELKDVVKSIKGIGELDHGLQVDAETTRELTKKEIGILKDYINGQASDGWGEGLFQTDIEGFSVFVWDGNKNTKYIKENSDNLDKSIKGMTKFGMNQHPLKLKDLKIGERQAFLNPIKISKEALDRYEFSYWNEYAANTSVTHIELNEILDNTYVIYLYEDDGDGYRLYANSSELQEFLDQQN